MGIDYYTCDICTQTFPDCGHYGNCKCKAIMCGYHYDRACKAYGSEESDDYGTVSCQCDNCSLTNITDEAIVKFLLKKMKTTRKKVEAEMRAKLQT